MQRAGEADDYGWFDEACVCSADSLQDSGLSSSSSSSSLGSRRPQLLAEESGPLALCVFSNATSSASCRVFEDGLSVQLAVPCFRIVQDGEGLRAEYQLEVCSEAQRLVVWKRYSHFSSMAASMRLSRGMLDWFVAPQRNRKFDLTQQSWLQLQSRRHWFRRLSVAYLAWKSAMLEEFLRNLLFESSSRQEFLLFVCAHPA